MITSEQRLLHVLQVLLLASLAVGLIASIVLFLLRGLLTHIPSGWF